MIYHLKSIFQRGIRAAHAATLDRGLPLRLAVCLHNLEAHQYPAFRAMVDYFARTGYRVVDPDEYLLEGAERRLLITFDDNYHEWYLALPLLDELHVRATFYVNTVCLRDRAAPSEITAYYERLGWRESRLPLSTKELRALAAAGHTIGTHTHAHRRLSELPLAVAKAEIRSGKHHLEDILGTRVRHFAYPYGMRRYFSEPLREYCIGIGFMTVANAISGRMHEPPEPTNLNRCVWHADRSLSYNVTNIRVDGRCYERLTGRSALG